MEALCQLSSMVINSKQPMVINSKQPDQRSYVETPAPTFADEKLPHSVGYADQHDIKAPFTRARAVFQPGSAHHGW